MQPPRQAIETRSATRIQHRQSANLQKVRRRARAASNGVWASLDARPRDHRNLQRAAPAPGDKHSTCGRNHARGGDPLPSSRRHERELRLGPAALIDARRMQAGIRAGVTDPDDDRAGSAL